jgi:RNA polymerase sigma-70 factor (ECF subfamily)
MTAVVDYEETEVVGRGRISMQAELVSLIAATADGDQQAFERLYAATRGKLYGIIFRIMRNAELADEVMRESYLHIWRNARDFDAQRGSPLAWMIAIGRNRAVDVMRRRTENSPGEEPAATDAAPGNLEPLNPREMTPELKRLLVCLGALEADRRNLLVLAYYDGLSREELAARFERPINTVKTWLRRSLIEIRECLES